MIEIYKNKMKAKKSKKSSRTHQRWYKTRYNISTRHFLIKALHVFD